MFYGDVPVEPYLYSIEPVSNVNELNYVDDQHIPIYVFPACNRDRVAKLAIGDVTVTPLVRSEVYDSHLPVLGGNVSLLQCFRTCIYFLIQLRETHLVFHTCNQEVD